MKKILAIILAFAVAMAMTACSSAPASSESEEGKKQLPVSSVDESSSEAPLYKDIMVPYSEIQHGKRIIIMQNTLVFVVS